MQFQLTRSRGAWPASGVLIEMLPLFQLTRSRGAWQARKWREEKNMNFNSHAHVERDICIYSDWIVKISISTHTLTWSVTLCERFNKWTAEFQLTRSRGAWLKNSSLQTVTTNFNSHAHVERDSETLVAYKQPKVISTHTLTWSVTKGMV